MLLIKLKGKEVWINIEANTLTLHTPLRGWRKGSLPFGNLLHRVHLRISNICNFFISEQKHKVWVVIFFFIDHYGHFGTKFIVFLEFFVSVP